MKAAYPDPELSDNRVVLRCWTLDDLHCIEEASTDPRIPAGTTVPEHFTPEAGRAFVERQWSRVDRGEGVSLAIESRALGRAVGLVAMMLRPQAGVIGLGYWVIPSARGEGSATAAATLAGEWAIGRGGFARIEAWVEQDNVASQAVLSAAGFEPEGLLRSFLATAGGRSNAFVYSRIAR